MKLIQRQNDTLLSIETDFDKFVAENFGDICQALAKHLLILIELEKLQRSSDSIKVNELIAVIRRSDEKDAQTNLINEFNISPETACFILNTSITELNQMLDPAYLHPLIDQHQHEIHALLKLDLDNPLVERTI